MQKGSNLAAQTLSDHKDEIIEAWIDGQLTDKRIRRDLFGDKQELREQSRAFAQELLRAVMAGDLENVHAPAYEPVKQVLEKIMARREQRGFTPFESAAAIICFKDFWGAYLQDAYRKDPDGLKKETVVVSKLIDTLALIGLEGVVKRREKVIGQQTTTILELSIPVVQVWDGVVVVPLIGTLDTERAQRLTEHLLHRVTETGSPIALLDITGVPTIDTKTAQHLIETIEAVRLLGCEAVLTGIRPSIAQTLVHLGIDLKNIKTRPSLAAGLRYAFSALSIEVVSKHSH